VGVIYPLKKTNFFLYNVNLSEFGGPVPLLILRFEGAQSL
jgi:hypothetical protein